LLTQPRATITHLGPLLSQGSFIPNSDILAVELAQRIEHHRTEHRLDRLGILGLVLVTHGRLADEFGAALEHVMGPQEQMEAITIGAYDDPDLCRTAIIEAVNRVDSGDGVVILTDMFGGTPSNLAISCMNRPNVDLLAEMNLPMLVKLAKVRQDRPLREAIDLAQEAGRKYVTIASSVLAGK